MSEILLLALGLLMGSLGGWYWAASRTRSSLTRLERELAEVKRRGAMAVEHARDERNQQIERRDQELMELRSRLDEKDQTAATSRATLQFVQEQKRQLEQTSTELTAVVEALRAELLAATNQSMLELAQFKDLEKSHEVLLEKCTKTVGAMESRLHATTRRLKELEVSSGGPSIDPEKYEVPLKAAGEE